MKKFSVDHYHNLNKIKTNFEVALSNMELISGISKLIFDDFPTNLPPTASAIPSPSTTSAPVGISSPSR